MSDTATEMARLTAEVAALKRELAERDLELDALRRQERVLQYIISTIPYYVFWKDRESVFLGCNEAFAGIAETTPEDIVGKSDFDMPWKREEAEFFRKVDAEVMDSRIPQLHIEEPQQRADGSERFLLTSKVPMLHDGEVTGILGIFADITERKQMELALARAKEAAEASDQAKSDFLAAMSHELRTPLTLILSPLRLLLGDATGIPEPVRQKLRLMLRNANRLKSLVDDVLDYTKAAARQYQVDWQLADPNEVVGNLVEEARPAAEAAGLQLRLQSATDMVALPIDVRMLEKIALNLIGNAIKFTGTGGHVGVSLDIADEEFILTVTDTGIGIAKDDLAGLFERFKQVDASSRRHRDGTGLGLALVKEFAEAMGGRVAVDSEPGVGSRFQVTLPVKPREELGELAPPAAGAADQTASAHREAGVVRHLSGNHIEHDIEHDIDAPTLPSERSPSTGEIRRRVLVVEDNADMRAYIESILARQFEVVSARNGKEALQELASDMPDLVVSDIMMPEMDGLQLLHAIKQNPDTRHLPVLLLTARAGEEDSIAGLETGADDYLSKPFSAAALLARARATDRLVQARAELDRAHHLALLGRMIGQFSHEIYNPSNVIFNNVEPLRQYLSDISDLLDAYQAAEPNLPDGGETMRALRKRLDMAFVLEDFDDALQAIRVSIERIVGVQDDMRGYLRGVAPKRVAGDVDACVQRAVRAARGRTPSGVEISAEYGGLPEAPIHQRQLEQVVGNLLDNAIHAVGDRGTLHVRTSVAAEVLRIEVSDDGPGVPHAMVGQIFEPFFTTKEVGKGMGLGLAICRQIMQHHGGTLFLDGSYTGGARFVATLTPADSTDSTDSTGANDTDPPEADDG